jgi:hypothetical protein
MIEGISIYLLEKLIGKAGEGIGEKTLGGLSKIASSRFRRFVNRKKLDFLSSDEDFNRVRSQLETLQQLYQDIFHKIDEMYQMAWPPERVGVFASDRVLLISSKLGEIEQRQNQIMEILEHLSRSCPSILILIGRLMTDFQDVIELLTVSRWKGILDQEFMFVTYVPRLINTRAGLIYAAKESIDRNLKVFENAVSSGDVDTATLIRMRKYERLSYVMGTAIVSAISFIDGAKKGAEIPKAVEAVSNLVKALRMETEILRRLNAGPLSDDLPQDKLWDAKQHRQMAFKMLSSEETGTIDERIDKVNLEAKKAIKCLRKIE